MAPGRPGGRDPEGAGGAHRDRPGRRRRRRHGLRHAGRRAERQHRPQRGAGRRLARDRSGHHGRSPVRLVPAGRPLRGPGGHRRRLRRGRGRRGRGHDPRADGRLDRRRQVRLPVRPARRRPLRADGRARPAGHLRRDDRREVGHHEGRDGRLRGAQPVLRRPGPRRGSLRAGDPARARRRGRADDDRRGHPGVDRREAGLAQAVLQGGRPGHRGQQLADHRRRGGDAHHERGEGGRPRADRRGRASWSSPSQPTIRGSC